MSRQLIRELLILISVVSMCFASEAFPQRRNNQPAQPEVIRKDFVQGNTNRSTPTPTPSRRALRLQVEVTIANSDEKVDGEKVELTPHETGITVSKRTNRDGIARFSQVPPGMVRIQMAVTQMDTFGQDYNLTDDNQTIKITLKKQQQ